MNILMKNYSGAFFTLASCVFLLGGLCSDDTVSTTYTAAESLAALQAFGTATEGTAGAVYCQNAFITTTDGVTDTAVANADLSSVTDPLTIKKIDFTKCSTGDSGVAITDASKVTIVEKLILSFSALTALTDVDLTLTSNAGVELGTSAVSQIACPTSFTNLDLTDQNAITSVNLSSCTSVTALFWSSQNRHSKSRIFIINGA